MTELAVRRKYHLAMRALLDLPCGHYRVGGIWARLAGRGCLDVLDGPHVFGPMKDFIINSVPGFSVVRIRVNRLTGKLKSVCHHHKTAFYPLWSADNPGPVESYYDAVNSLGVLLTLLPTARFKHPHPAVVLP